MIIYKIILLILIFYTTLSEANSSFEEIKFSNEYTQKGINLVKTKQYEDALECFNKAIKLTPQKSSLHFRKGSVLLRLKRYEEAINEYDKALEINTNHNSDSSVKIKEKLY